jgi:hypothetical protein
MLKDGIADGGCDIAILAELCMHRECERLARIGAGRMPAFPDVRLQLMAVAIL